MNYQDMVTKFFDLHKDRPFPNQAQMIAIRQFAGWLENQAAQQSVQADGATCLHKNIDPDACVCLDCGENRPVESPRR